jgi:hypothetical protein
VTGGLASSLTSGGGSGALVTATPTSGSAIVLTETATAGTYSTTALPAGDYTVTATKDDHTPGAAATAVSSLPGTSITAAVTRTILSNPSLTISLTTSAAGNADINDATVTATHNTTAAVVSLTPIGSGDYRSGNVPPGTYTVRATAPTHDAEVDAAVVVVEGVNKTSSLVLDRFGTLTVTVNSSMDADGIGAGDPATLTPTDGATVTATNTTTGAVHQVTQVGSGAPVGDYAVSDLPPGTYSVAATLTGHNGGTATSTVTVSPTDADTATVDLLKWPDLVVDVNSLVNDVATAALSGATVTATSTSGGAPITIGETGVTGIHSLLGVTPGTYTVAATKTGYVTHSANVTVVAGAQLSLVGTTSTHIARVLARYPTVTIDVDDGENANAPFSGVTVTLTNTSTSAVITMPETGTAGQYQALLVPPGTYDVRAVADSYVAGTVTGVAVGDTGNEGDDVTVDAVAGGAAGDDLVLVRGATITVTVNSRLGAVDTGLDGAEVTAVNSTTGETFFLDENPDGTVGNYRSANIPAGTYTVNANAPGHASNSSATTPAAVTASLDGTATINLSAYPDLTVTVTGTSAGVTAALSGATVTATRTALTGGGPAITLGETATAGTYQTLDLPPGTYNLSASKSGYTTDNDDTATSTAGTAIATVAMGPLIDSTIFTVTVRSEVSLAGTPSTVTYAELTGATVTATRRAGGSVTLTHQHDGVYSGAITQAGTYDLNVSANGHTSRLDDNDSNFTTNVGDGWVVVVGGADVSRTVDLPAVNGSVTGDVRNLLGTLQANISVTASNGDVTVGPVLTGDIDADADDGVYLLSGLSPGVWSVTFSHDDIAPLTINVTVPYGSAVDTGAALTGVDVVVAPAGGAIHGQVLEAATLALPISAGNPATGIGDVTVRLRAANSGTDLATFAVTSSNNYWYAFSGIDAGTYDVVFDIDTVARPGYVDATVEDIGVSGGEIVPQSYIFDAPNKSVTFHAGVSESNVDVAGARFTLTNSALTATAFDSAVTDSSGNVTITDVPYGAYTLTMHTTPTGYLLLDDPSQTIIVSPSVSTTSVEMTFAAVGTISGTVSTNDDAAYTGLAPSYNDGGPATAGTVTVTHASGYSTNAVITATTGAYSVQVPVGTSYTVTFSHTSYTSDVEAGVNVTAGGTTTVDGTIDMLASFTIAVKDHANVDLDGVAVSLFQNVDGTGAVVQYVGGGSAVAAGGDAHTFNVTGIDPSVDTQLHIRGTKTGYTQVTDSVVALTAGANGTKTLVLEENVDLAMTVTGLVLLETATVTFTWTVPILGGSANAVGDFSSTVTTDSVSLPASTAMTWAASAVAGKTFTINNGGTDVDFRDGTVPAQTAGTNATFAGAYS